VRVSDAERESGAVHPLIEFHDAEHFAARFVHGVFFGGNRDMAEAEGFDQGVDDLDVRDGFMCCGPCGCWYEGQLLAAQFAGVGHKRTVIALGILPPLRRCFGICEGGLALHRQCSEFGSFGKACSAHRFVANRISYHLPCFSSTILSSFSRVPSSDPK
jgi:hypothetical protein